MSSEETPRAMQRPLEQKPEANTFLIKGSQTIIEKEDAKEEGRACLHRKHILV